MTLKALYDAGDVLKYLFLGLLFGTPVIIFIFCLIIKKIADRIPKNNRMPSSEEIRAQRLKAIWGDRRL
jgi:hypothetical protein